MRLAKHSRNSTSPKASQLSICFCRITTLGTSISSKISGERVPKIKTDWSINLYLLFKEYGITEDINDTL